MGSTLFSYLTVKDGIIAKYDELSRDKYPKKNRKYLCNVHK